MTTLEEVLNSRLIGQKQPIGQICRLLARSREGFRYPNQPEASILALGPTGVGKTDTILIASEYLYGKPPARFDMSEYNTMDGLTKMLGDGKNEAIFEILHAGIRGEGIVLFDEIEKAHTLVLDVLLQALSTGNVRLYNGTSLDLTKCIFWCTSNIGSMILMDSQTEKAHVIADRIDNAAQETLRPEIIGRFNLKVAYEKLGEDDCRPIAEIHAKNALDIVNSRGHGIAITDKVIDEIKRKGYSEKYGARPLKDKAMELIGDTVLRKQRETGNLHIKGTLDFTLRTGEFSIS